MDLEGLPSRIQLLEALCLQVFMDLDGLPTGKLTRSYVPSSLHGS